METSNAEAGLILEVFDYPLSPAAQAELIELWRTEWPRTDYDWLEAMNGDYSEALTIMSVLARRHGEAVATATVHFTRRHPEIAVLGSVLTRRAYRGAGLGGQVVVAALAQAQAAGCALCLLGTAKKPRNVYLRHGFTWQNGTVMARKLKGTDFAHGYFAAGQPAQLRPATWGDLPGLTLLMAQPMAILSLDYPRGLLSGRYVALDRCLSNFPVLWYDTVVRGGLLIMLAAPETDRVFGFGSATRAPGAGRRHTAIIEFAAHDNHAMHLPAMLAHLLEGCRAREIRRVEAYVATRDAEKRACLLAAGFKEVGRLAQALQLADDRPVDVILLDRAL